MENDITTKMLNTQDIIIKTMLRKDDFTLKLKELKNSVDDLSRMTVIRDLMDMFGALGIECLSGKPYRYYEELVNNSDLPSFSDICAHVVNVMYDNFEFYPTPESFMKRIVDRCCCAKDGWENDTLRLRILKQYVKYGDFMTYRVRNRGVRTTIKTVSVYSGKKFISAYVCSKLGKKNVSAEEAAEVLEDDIFDKYYADGSVKADIIKIADNLSKGIFRIGRNVRKDLYYFAMVFNMTYTEKLRPSDSERIIDYRRDIESNLFEDYYANNLMRYILSEYDVDDAELGGFVSDPSGRGINFKSFEEMVYLYYLAKGDELSPSEKIMMSEAMIARLKETGKENEPSGTGEEISMNTRYMEENFAVSHALDMDEDDFEEYLLKNYPCVRKGAENAAAAQNTAAKVFSDISYGLDLTECDQSLWFTEENKRGELETGNIQSILKVKECEKLTRFINLIYGINRYLADTKKLAGASPKTITRTLVITAYYYKYMIDESSGEVSVKSFLDIYSDFTNSRTGLNYYLNQAGYQPLSAKNIFDMSVMLGAYISLNA